MASGHTDTTVDHCVTIRDLHLYLTEHIDLINSSLWSALITERVISPEQQDAIISLRMVKTSEKKINRDALHLEWLQVMTLADSSYCPCSYESFLIDENHKERPKIYLLLEEAPINDPGVNGILHDMQQVLKNHVPGIQVENVCQEKCDFEPGSHVVKVVPPTNTYLPSKKDKVGTSCVVFATPENLWEENNGELAEEFRDNHLAGDICGAILFLGNTVLQGWKNYLMYGDKYAVYYPSPLPFCQDRRLYQTCDGVNMSVVIGLGSDKEESVNELENTLMAIEKIGKKSQVPSIHLNIVVQGGSRFTEDIDSFIRQWHNKLEKPDKITSELVVLTKTAQIKEKLMKDSIWLLMTSNQPLSWFTMVPVNNGIPHLVYKSGDLCHLYKQLSVDTEPFVLGQNEDLQSKLSWLIENRQEVYQAAAKLSETFHLSTRSLPSCCKVVRDIPSVNKKPTKLLQSCQRHSICQQEVYQAAAKLSETFHLSTRSLPSCCKVVRDIPSVNKKSTKLLQSCQRHSICQQEAYQAAAKLSETFHLSRPVREGHVQLLKSCLGKSIGYLKIVGESLTPGLGLAEYLDLLRAEDCIPGYSSQEPGYIKAIISGMKRLFPYWIFSRESSILLGVCVTGIEMLLQIEQDIMDDTSAFKIRNILHVLCLQLNREPLALPWLELTWHRPPKFQEEATVNIPLRRRTEIPQSYQEQGEELLSACRDPFKGTEIIKRSISKGADVNFQDQDGQTPLMVLAACRTLDRENTMQTLLKAGAEVNLANKRGRTALMEVTIGNLGTVLETINNGSRTEDFREWSWHDFVRIRKEECRIVESMIHIGAQVNSVDERGRTPLMEMAKGSLGNFLEISQTYTPLKELRMWSWHDLVRIRQNECRIVKSMIQAGAQVNSVDERGRTPLMEMAKSSLGNIFETIKTFTPRIELPKWSWHDFVRIRKEECRIVESMIHMGAQVNSVDERGRTPLMEMAKSSLWNLFEIIKTYTPRKELPEWFWHVLMSIRQNECRIVESMIHVGAQVNFVDENGRTALMEAVDLFDFQPHVDWMIQVVHLQRYIIDMLLESGADVNLVDKKGQTALSLAEASGFPEVIGMLRARTKDTVLTGEVSKMADLTIKEKVRKPQYSTKISAKGFLPGSSMTKLPTEVPPQAPDPPVPSTPEAR